MSELNDWFSKFKTFLNILFVRRKKEGWNANDFEKDKLEYLEDHLEDLLPLMSLEEAQRINIYLHNAYIFHLNNGLRIPNIFPQRSSTPDPVILQVDEQHYNMDKRDKGDQSLQEERHEAQLRPVDNSETHSHQFESDYLMETHKTVGPLSQSTPLSVPFLPSDPRLYDVQQKGPIQDIFISDIVAHISISPIPIESAPSCVPNIQQHQAMSTPIIDEGNEISFLRNFAHIEDKEIFDELPCLTKNIRRKTQKRLIPEVMPREPKKRMDKIKFHVLCCYQHENRTDEQIKRSEDSYLYFSLLREKQTDITSKNNTESDRRYTSLLRAHNLSNILRAHASQSQISVEQPVQMSSTRSPVTPQGVLRASTSFTPLRGDLSSFEPRMVLDQASSFPTGSLQRPQHLLTIPERDSSIYIPLHPQDEDINTQDQATFSNLPREDLENVGISEEQSLQIAYNDPSQNDSRSNQAPLNNSIINIQPLIQHEPIFPVEVVEDQLSNVPGIVPKDFQIIEEPQLPTNPLIIVEQSQVKDAETCQDLNTLTDAPISLPGVCQEQVLLDQVEQSMANDNIPLMDVESENPQSNWFEILRPREGFVEYPREIPTNRRKRRKRRRRESTDSVDEPRRRHELPFVSSENINKVAIVHNGDPVRTPEVEVPNQMTQNNENFVEDFPENPLGTPVEFPEAHGISQQVTQYPIPIETELKEYLVLIKQAGRKIEYINWEHFDSCLFNESDNFELHTNIFKRIIKDSYVAMNELHNQGTSRVEAAKAFRFILDLKTMGLIEIESIDAQILGIRLITELNIKKL